ncbi:MAG: hypothetical protein ETSY1_12130 [Candidatus Entotheonella factor]|uniref:Uncharacterized protein n=1 Tax=Entotheonella factor TaxID=1429438 RepID=W4LQP0_ENTF1|nr:MAG: hypothetical protein ETSY1_12130 [Candidatus Entotheonella factor]
MAKALLCAWNLCEERSETSFSTIEMLFLQTFVRVGRWVFGQWDIHGKRVHRWA